MASNTVVIVGAGPYGLSAAAHMLHAGLKPYVIGRPMAFWKEQMPKKMILRSKQEASNIAAPQKHLSLEAYRKVLGRRLPDPLPIEEFIAYGEWFQKQVCPDVDTRLVRQLSQVDDGFGLRFEDGDFLHARSVVLALGIGPFRYRPEQFQEVTCELAPHSSDLNDLSEFRGKRVAVVGSGQSALEYAAILHEQGARVELLTRSASVKFRPFAWRKHLFRQLTPGPLRGLSYFVLPPTDLGDIRTARKMADPEKFRQQSPEIQEKLINDCTKPVGAHWLAPRLRSVPVKTKVTVTSASVTGDELKLTLSNGEISKVDRVVLATGYRIDVSKYGILDAFLRRQIVTTPDGYPELTAGLETSVSGLFMAGVVGEKVLGPTLRFVTGTSNAGPRLAAAVAGRSNHPTRQKWKNETYAASLESV